MTSGSGPTGRLIKLLAFGSGLRVGLLTVAFGSGLRVVIINCGPSGRAYGSLYSIVGLWVVIIARDLLGC